MPKPTLEELCRGFKQAYPAAITDILDGEFNLRHQWLGPDIKPLTPEMRVAGPAFTIRWVNDPLPGGKEKIELLKRLIDSMQAFMVPTIDSSKNKNAGYWGELMCSVCHERSIDGAVIDGGVRDAYYIYKLRFNIFASFTCPNEADTRSRIESFQQPIYINGVLIRPGDFIIGDLGGVVVVPQEIVVDVYRKMQEVIKRESRIRRMIRQGQDIEELLREGAL